MIGTHTEKSKIGRVLSSEKKMHQRQLKKSGNLFNTSESGYQVNPHTVNQEVGLATSI